MKKFALILAAALTVSAVFAASYKNNTYQKLAKEYTVKAQRALDAGEYALSEEYAKKAEENAALSEEYIRHMLAKDNADKAMKAAQEKIAYVEKIHGDVNFPIAYEAAVKAYGQAEGAYTAEDYEGAERLAKTVLETLAEIYEITPLPKYYIVRPWATDKDCFWNISGRPYVYNNPFLWENLYEANKSKLPKPSDPNLILPGMKMEIPSITGEYRDGVYSPDVEYEPYKPAK
ncbi:hypothetical protein [Treponema sp.]|uniref:LysM peptidoglycan-binding domain-containing protein n=1 Tax=Treponema sp. TaxID=166 RepID=UPI0025DCBEBF|nr:hypothetical protein [Treponema sp.]MCR5218942.1 hypothetical protein [Treponema sp.]